MSNGMLKNKRKYKGRINSSFRLDPDVKRALERAVKQQDKVTMSDIVNKALRNYLSINDNNV